MDFSAVMNLVLGGGLVATIIAIITLKSTVREARAKAEKATAEAETVRIDNTEHATRILIENIVEPLKEELNENMDSLVPASKISDMPTGWICGQTARDFIQTKTGIGGSMNVQESEEFKTSKFFCKTDFDMKEIKKEEAVYVPLPKFYTFKSREERERILYRNFVNVGIEVKEMIKDVLNKRGAK